MSPRAIRSPLLAGLLCAGALAHAATLATVSFDLHYKLPSNGVASAAIKLQFYYALAPGGLGDLDTRVFDDLALTAADAGHRYTLSSSADDPQLPAFLAHATNGFDDDFHYDAIGLAGGGIGQSNLESGTLLPTVTFGGPDLAGQVVTGLELLIADIVIDDAAQAGGFNWQIAGQLRFLGDPRPVPVPGALALFASGVAGLVRRVRRA